MKSNLGFNARWFILLFFVLFIVYFRNFDCQHDSSADQNKGSDPESPSENWWKTSPFWSEDQKPHRNPHRFKYLINEPNKCPPEEPVELLIMVTSAVAHEDRRLAIRNTWGRQLTALRSKLIFLLGQGRDQQSKIVEESELYHDIVQEDFEDTYHNLTLKTIMGLKWISIFCSQSKYVMKTDDDIFVNTGFLLGSISSKADSFSRKIHGCVKNSPLNSPQPIPKEGQAPHSTLMKPALPEFVAGAGYLIPGKFVPELYIASLSTKSIPVEDAYTTGYCAKKIGAHPPQNDPRFSCGQLVTDDCEMKRKFTGHKVTPERMWAIEEKLSNNQCK